MNRDDIMRMAREAGLEEEWIIDPGSPERFERFAALVSAAEREACAKVCEDAPEPDGQDLADRIRARGQA